MTYKSMTYEEAAAYIEETPKFTKKNTLENTKAILRHLGDPQEHMKILHVAGTKWKGLSLLLSGLYAACGRKAHGTVYLSPFGGGK